MSFFKLAHLIPTNLSLPFRPVISISSSSFFRSFLRNAVERAIETLISLLVALLSPSLSPASLHRIWIRQIAPPLTASTRRPGKPRRRRRTPWACGAADSWGWPRHPQRLRWRPRWRSGASARVWPPQPTSRPSTGCRRRRAAVGGAAAVRILRFGRGSAAEEGRRWSGDLRAKAR